MTVGKSVDQANLAAQEGSGARTAIVLAAGMGKRMRSSLPKVLHPVLGRTMLGHVLTTTAEAFPAIEVAVVVGHGADLVRQHLAEVAPDATAVLQERQRGTGDAVAVALAALPEVTGTVIVLNGDIPLVRPQTLVEMVAGHQRAGASASVLTAQVADPSGLGRIVRAADRTFAAIVEERDATAEQRALSEVNAGAYAFDAAALRECLSRLSTDNDQGEQYLTDVLGMLVADGATVLAHQAADPVEALGANDRAELATLRAIMRDRVNLAWMRAGVSIIDPATTWIDVTVTLGVDALIEPNTHLRGTTSVAESATVGPDTTLIDTSVGAGASVVRAHALSSQIGPDALVGPFAYLRPGSKLCRKAKVGTFVETKASEIGEGAKVPHLTYVGDATIGEGTNIGASSVFVNYDGVKKHRTTIGANARTGSDNMFIAPVEVGDGAYTAAGSVITDNVPPGAMAVARARQRNIPGWVERRRAGTPAAEAARRAVEREQHHDGSGSFGPASGTGQE